MPEFLKRVALPKLTRFEQKEANEYGKQLQDRADVKYEHNISRIQNPVRKQALFSRHKLEAEITMAIKD